MHRSLLVRKSVHYHRPCRVEFIVRRLKWLGPCYAFSEKDPRSSIASNYTLPTCCLSLHHGDRLLYCLLYCLPAAVRVKSTRSVVGLVRPCNRGARVDDVGRAENDWPELFPQCGALYPRLVRARRQRTHLQRALLRYKDRRSRGARSHFAPCDQVQDLNLHLYHDHCFS